MPSKGQKKRERDRHYVRTSKTSADRSEYDYYNRDIKCNQKRSCTSSKESYHKDLEKSRHETAARSKVNKLVHQKFLNLKVSRNLCYKKH